MDGRDVTLKELRSIPCVSEKCAEGMYLIGIRRKEDLSEKDPDAMYEELRGRNDFYAEPCMLNMLRIAVSTVRKQN